VLTGEGRAFVVSGEPGVGKTRLVQEVTLVARNRGFAIAAGSCYEGTECVPFYPFTEALGTLVELAPASVTARIPSEWSDLCRLLPGQHAELSLPDLPEESQPRIFWAVSSFIEAIAIEKPVLFMIDDVHWADSSTLGLFQHLAHHTRGSRVLLIATYRDVDVNRKHPLEETLHSLAHERLTERVMLRRFDEEATRELVLATTSSAEVSEGFSDLIFARTDGNPFFVEEVSKFVAERSARRMQSTASDDVLDLDVPESVRSAIGQRLSGLSDEAQQVLAAASALRLAFRFDDLLDMNGHSDEDLERLLEESVAHGLVVPLPQSGSDMYAFNHALTQQTIYSEISPRRRRRLHLSAAEALERLPEPARNARIAELAKRYFDADVPDKALTYAMQAGESANDVFAHGEAVRQFRVAADLATEIQDAAAERAALSKLGSSLSATGAYTQAILILEQAIRLHRRVGDVEAEREAMATMGRVYARQGLGIVGSERLSESVQAVGETETRLGAAHLLIAYSSLLFLVGDFSEQLAVSQRATTMARELGNDVVIGQALGRLGTALGINGEYDAGVETMREAIDIAERCGDLDTLNMALQNGAVALSSLGRTEDAREYLRRSVDVATRLGSAFSLASARAARGNEMFMAGYWDEARRIAEDAVALSGNESDNRAAAAVRVFLTFIDGLQTGNVECERKLAEMQTHADVSGNLNDREVAGFYRAWLELEFGMYQQALEHLRKQQPFGIFRERFNTEAFIAVALLGLNQVEESLTVSRLAVDQAVTPLDQGFRLYVHGMALKVAGRLDEAREFLDKALDRRDDRPFVMLEAMARQERGDVDLRSGKLPAAEVELNKSLQLFTKLQMAPRIKQVEGLLASASAAGATK
jgi:tetratricopeptide (TPR) repeat protein